MTSIEIFDTGGKAEIPSSWDEMTPAQIHFVFRLHAQCLTKEISPLEFSIRVLYNFLGLKRNKRSTIWDNLHPQEAMERNANLYMLCEKTLAFLFQDGSANLAFSSVKNPLPIIYRGFFHRPLIGPGDFLQDLTFSEYRHAAIALNEFFKSKDLAALDESIAHLYRVRTRRPNLAGRMVADVDPEHPFEEDVHRVAVLPIWQKILIMQWFSTCINHLQTGKICIDGEELDMTRLFKDAEDSSFNAQTFTLNDLLIQIAKDQTIGNLDRVDREPLMSILLLIWHNFKEAKNNETTRKAH